MGVSIRSGGMQECAQCCAKRQSKSSGAHGQWPAQPKRVQRSENALTKPGIGSFGGFGGSFWKVKFFSRAAMGPVRWHSCLQDESPMTSGREKLS